MVIRAGIGYTRCRPLPDQCFMGTSSPFVRRARRRRTRPGRMAGQPSSKMQTTPPSALVSSAETWKRFARGPDAR